MISFLVAVLTSKWWLLNCLIGVIMLEMGLSGVKPLYPKNKADKERDEKYAAFRRNDLNSISRWKMYLAAPLVLIKWLIGWGAWVILALAVVLIHTFIHKKGEPLEPGSLAEIIVRKGC